MIKMEAFSEMINSGQAILVLWTCAILLFSAGIFSIIYVWNNLKITVKYSHFFAMQKMSGVMRTKAFYFGGLCLMIGSVCTFYAITNKGIAVPMLLPLSGLILFCGLGDAGKWAVGKLPIDRCLKSILISSLLIGIALLYFSRLALQLC